MGEQARISSELFAPRARLNGWYRNTLTPAEILVFLGCRCRERRRFQAVTQTPIAQHIVLARLQMIVAMTAGNMQQLLPRL
jgi:hypothetical protein